MSEPAANVAVRIEALATERQFRPAFVARWRAAAVPDAAALLDLAEWLRPSENQLRDFLDWAEEIAVRDGSSIAALLASEPIQRLRARELSRNDATKAVREALRRLRFPQLTRMEDEIAEHIRALKLPAGVRLLLPPDLQDDEIRIEVRARDVAAVRHMLHGLSDAVEGPEIERIFALLREAP